MKLKLKTSIDSSATPITTPQAQAPTPGGSGGGLKLKLGRSQPPTPAEASPFSHSATADSATSQVQAQAESQPQPPPAQPAPRVKRPYNKKPKPDPNHPSASASSSKKRSANDDISPAPKRSVPAAPARRLSVKFNSHAATEDDPSQTTPLSAAPRLKLNARKQSIGPKSIQIVSRKAPPKRPIGVGYDSEASDAELDPIIEQQFVLRMQPGDDCDYLREAIANRTLGLKPDEGGANVSMRFLEKDLRRALITIQGRNYAAALVDLPCVIEGMKSWDKRGWWKVADICQMLLVLGPTQDEASAKSHPLPREVDKNTWAYAHGLTPPMHWVRKRRFRKRASYKTMEYIDEEVERLLKADELAVQGGGSVKYEIVDSEAARNTAMDDEYDEEEEEPPSGYIDSTENNFGQGMLTAEPEEGVEGTEDYDDTDLAAQLGAALEADDQPDLAANTTADAAASLGAVLSAATPSSGAAAPSTSTPATPADADADADQDADGTEASSDEDDYASDASPDAIDEDLVAQQAELEAQRSQVEDLEREVENARIDYERQKNALLKQRALNKYRSLQDELGMKRRTFGLEGDEE